MDFLALRHKTIVVFGVANRKSVAYHVGTVLQEAGADVVYVVHDERRRRSVAKLLGESPPIQVCDVESEDQIRRVRDEIGLIRPRVDGILHSIAFADYSGGVRAFHETGKSQFLRALDVSCFSLIAIAHAFKELLTPDASVVTLSISTTRMANENYGCMAPAKAALDSALVFLAKSFSSFSRVRFNAVAPGLLKTSASAGIPGYVDAYLYAEAVIPRKRAVQTEEVAHVAAFLLSSRSSGINGQSIIVDAGMAMNYFDPEIIRRVVR
jgi:enoyl-[acyl-carrier protein] reductase I